MATEIGSLLIDLRADVARLSQDMAKAQSTVEGAMNKVKSSAAAAVTALGLIGVGVSVAGMVGIVKNAINATAALDDMAARAGTTVENMSALVDVAKIGGHDIGIMEGAMVRLTKALAGGDDEAKGAGHALAALGLNAEKLRRMDTAEAMLTVAKALDTYGDSGKKTALLLNLLGKNGAAALPYLQDLAETGRLNASVTTEQAAAAERLEKDINAVKLEGEKMTRAMVAGMLPAMGDIAKAMRQAAEDGGTLKALFVGFGGLADQFVRPWKAAFLGLGAGLNEMLATFEEGLAKITFGGVADRHRAAALAYRDAAREMNLQIAALDNRRGPEAPGEKKPDLPYKPPAHGGKKSPLDTLMDQQRKRLAEIAAQAGDEQMVSADSVSRQYDKTAADELEKRRIAMEEMAEKRMEYTRIETEGEEAIREALEKTGKTGKDTFRELTDAVQSWSNKAADAFADFVVDGKGSFSDLVNSMLKDIVRLQAKQMLDPVTKGASGFLSKIFGNLFGGVSDSPVLHGGGIVGQEQAGFRALSPLAFAAAPRFHSGGIAGDEVPAVLKRGEGVFTPGQMAALGGGGAGVTVVQHLNFAVGVSQTVRAEVMNLMPQIQAAAQGAVMDARLRGGSTRAAFRG